jgi:pimeloyl-ACP methyl ester carboxylesterase
MALEQPALAGVEHRYVELPEFRMHVAEAGEGDPVLLLHGFPQNWWEWRSLIPLLSERRRVICPDLRGAGWSGVPAGGYDKETMADDVLRMLDSLGVERVGLIGHDVGGFVAFLVCLWAPERVTRFVSLNTGHPYVRPTPSALGTLWRFWYWPLLGAPLLGPWLLRHRVFERFLMGWFGADRAGWTAEDAALFGGLWAGRTRSVAGSKWYRSYLATDSPRVLFGRYRRSSRLTVPTLMLHGLDDRILREPFLRGFEPYADEMSLELVPGAGHFVAEERAQFVAERALAFLGE